MLSSVSRNLIALLVAVVFSIDLLANDQEETIIFKDDFQLPVPTFLLNDTGIDWCANSDTTVLDCPLISHPNQDGDFGRDTLALSGQLPKIGAGVAGFDLTKLDEDGAALPADASEWSCVRDNVTNLVWEIKSDNSSDFRHMDFTFSWRNPDSSENGGASGSINEGACFGISCDTHAYVQAVNTTGLCGASDWRVPSIEELLSIAHFGALDFRNIDTGYFFDMPSETMSFWSSTTVARNSSEAWAKNFTVPFPGTTSIEKSRGLFLRLTRSD